MERETTVTILPAENGSAAITQGSATGKPTRTVTVTAYPNSGFEFVGFELEKAPLRITPFSVGGYTTDVASMCGDGITTLQTEFSTNLYTDGTLYYTDEYAVRVAPNGYYGAGSNNYFQLFDGRIIGTFTCQQISQPIVVSSTGGGGGGTYIGNTVDSGGINPYLGQEFTGVDTRFNVT